MRRRTRPPVRVWTDRRPSIFLAYRSVSNTYQSVPISDASVRPSFQSMSPSVSPWSLRGVSPSVFPTHLSVLLSDASAGASFQHFSRSVRIHDVSIPPSFWRFCPLVYLAHQSVRHSDDSVYDEAAYLIVWRPLEKISSLRTSQSSLKKKTCFKKAPEL